MFDLTRELNGVYLEDKGVRLALRLTLSAEAWDLGVLTFTR